MLQVSAKAVVFKVQRVEQRLTEAVEDWSWLKVGGGDSGRRPCSILLHEEVAVVYKHTINVKKK